MINRSLASFAIACAVLFGSVSPTGTSRASFQWTEPRTGMVFVKVEPGRFVMGSPPDEIGREAQERQHHVTVSRSFWLGAFEVTQHQWQAVMGQNPSWFSRDAATRPVENVTWFQVKDFLQRLTKRGGTNRFRLPTEAEWEYACRAGTTTAYATGSILTHAQANFAQSPESVAAGRGQTMAVGSFPPNAWGFHDMHGNVWEWTEDAHCPYSSTSAIDPVATCRSPLKVIRGGSWYFGADSARCALRYTHRPQDRGFSLGFRVVRELAVGAR
jgi:formylglycine-generating enzyme required for sulfatase activity